MGCLSQRQRGNGTNNNNHAVVVAAVTDRVVLAPMIRGSEMAFRRLIHDIYNRDHDKNEEEEDDNGRSTMMVCYSPMLHADILVAALQEQEQEQQQEAAVVVVDDEQGGATTPMPPPPQQQQRQRMMMKRPQHQDHEDVRLFLQDAEAAVDAPSERLVIQLCGNNPATLAAACRIILRRFFCSSDDTTKNLVGLDLNLGCPQSRARDGGFGAFLSREKAVQCVLHMRRAIDDWYNDNEKKQKNIAKNDDHDKKEEEKEKEEKADCGTSAVASTTTTTTTMGNEKDVNNTTSQRRNMIRLSCKMRLRDEGLDETIGWANALAAAGCEILAVHCRRRDCKFDGAADLNAGRAIVQAASPGMPVYISGADVKCWQDVETILAYTGAAKLMLARPLLANPELLLVREYDNNDDDDDAANAAASTCAPDAAADAATGKTSSATQVDVRAVHLAARYLQMAEHYPPPTAEYIRLHLKWFWRSSLQPPPPRDNDNKNGPIDYHNIRYKLWNFLQRPYLTSLAQYRAVTVLTCHSLHIAVPPSLLSSSVSTSRVPSSTTLIRPAPAPPPPTFKSIRHMNDDDDPEKNKRKRVDESVVAGIC